MQCKGMCKNAGARKQALESHGLEFANANVCTLNANAFFWNAVSSGNAPALPGQRMQRDTGCECNAFAGPQPL